MNPHEYLNSFVNFESHLQKISSRHLNLERVRRLLHALGDPQNGLKFIHVAGTKGKGSTCIFIAHILRAAGYKVGLYTSPHFYVINERIRILDPKNNDRSCDFEGSILDDELKRLVARFKPQFEKFRHDRKLGNLTYFEILTSLAVCHFAQRKTDIVVLETGLGGRLDATNAVDAIIDVLTPIGFDHMHLLGNTLEKIAAEKAAIIKNGSSKVVVSAQNPKARNVILKRCRDFGIEPVVIGKDVQWSLAQKGTLSVHGEHNVYRDLKMSLSGGHQSQNAAAAVAVIELLPAFGFKVSPKAIASGIREARWPGRFEMIGKTPAVIIDCAHNVDSARALVAAFKDRFHSRKSVLVLGISTDKDVDGICRIINPIADKVVLTRADHPRAQVFDLESMKKIFKKKHVVDTLNVKDAVAQAYELAGREDVILATGSVFLAAQFRAEVKHVSV